MRRPLLSLAVLAALLSCQAEPRDGVVPVPEEAPEGLPDSMEPRGYLCYRSPGAIEVDGRLDDAAWDAAPWSSTFRDIEASTQPEPTWPTRMKMLWDDDYLYVAAKMVEPNVWATLTEHDSVIFHDNDFEVFIDPDGDRHEYYEYEINALGTDWDLRLVKPYTDGGPAVDAWEIPGLLRGVHVEGTLNDPSDEDEYWSVELAFPWAVLAEYANRPCPPEDRDQWRMGFSRVEWDVEVVDGQTRKIPDRPEHNWTWTDQKAVNMHLPEHWGYVQFTTADPGEGVYRVDPARPARALLARVHHAQRAHRETHGHFSAELSELDLELTERETASVRMAASETDYLAAVAVWSPDGAIREIMIGGDGRMRERRP